MTALDRQAVGILRYYSSKMGKDGLVYFPFRKKHKPWATFADYGQQAGLLLGRVPTIKPLHLCSLSFSEIRLNAAKTDSQSDLISRYCNDLGRPCARITAQRHTGKSLGCNHYLWK